MLIKRRLHGVDIKYKLYLDAVGIVEGTQLYWLASVRYTQALHKEVKSFPLLLLV